MLWAPLLLQQSSKQQTLASDTAAHLRGIAKAKAVEWRADSLLNAGGQQRHVCSSSHEANMFDHQAPFDTRQTKVRPDRSFEEHSQLHESHGLQLSDTEGVLQTLPRAAADNRQAKAVVSQLNNSTQCSMQTLSVSCAGGASCTIRKQHISLWASTWKVRHHLQPSFCQCSIQVLGHSGL